MEHLRRPSEGLHAQRLAPASPADAHKRHAAAARASDAAPAARPPRKVDIYRETFLRYVAFTSDCGEAFKPFISSRLYFARWGGGCAACSRHGGTCLMRVPSWLPHQLHVAQLQLRHHSLSPSCPPLQLWCGGGLWHGRRGGQGLAGIPGCAPWAGAQPAAAGAVPTHGRPVSRRVARVLHPQPSGRNASLRRLGRLPAGGLGLRRHSPAGRSQCCCGIGP